MSELGQLLKKARLEKGLSLDDVQEATKIRKRYLEAIEEGDYKVLPGSFYVRAFVKTYAETVGLNPDEILQYYRNDIPATEPETNSEPIIRKKRSVQHSDRFGRWATTLLMWAFVILIFVILYFFLVKTSDTPNNQTADDTKITDSESPSPVAGEGNKGDTAGGNGGNTSTEPPVTPEPEPEPKPIVVLEKSSRSEDNFVVAAPDNGKLEVEITSTGGYSWLGVFVGNRQGERLYYENLDDGKTVKYEMPDKGMAIRMGRADFITVKIAGEVIPDGDVAGLKNMNLKLVPYEEAQKLQQEAGGAGNTGNSGANGTSTP
ncbi:helix-turn-helix domain-containing protein [Paenibacillus profundus]|uniref:Helix-turn-helix domain-containing protein n=1 Tax=Paenibacillus profundus TaxID=1173085 RepID=A0ABS8Y8Q9_9BACL|nr:RodZ family helix-turn-helix domain-containing protein [Paenibacillus profundus]MCE5168125.1 helix-turn-helix domain-containing protein [Paenibacillus profundus]